MSRKKSEYYIDRSKYDEQARKLERTSNKDTSREAIAKYSFLLSTPVVAAAALVKMKDFVFGIPFILGVLASFIVGLFVIKFLLKFLQKGSFKVFAIYRVVLGVIVLGILFSRM